MKRFSPLLVRHSGATHAARRLCCPPLHVDEVFAPYGRAERARLAPGDLLALYTDGITEARDAADSTFDTTRLVQVVRAARGQSAATAHAGLLRSVGDFTGATPPADDITLLLLAREPVGGPPPSP